MFQRKHLLIVLLTVFFLLTVLLLRTFKEDSEDSPILLAEATKRSFSVVVEAVGELDAARSTVLLSQISGDRGKIIYLIGEGTKVRRNDVLVRLDPTYFEDKVNKFSAKVKESEALESAYEQALEWEKIQAEREVKTAEFDLHASELDLLKLEKGEGPLELARLEVAAQEAKRDFEEKTGYLGDLKALEKQGYVNQTEISQARSKAAEAKRAYDITKRQHESYRDYVLPSFIEKARAQVARSKINVEQTKKASGFKIGEAMAALRKAREELNTATSSLKSAQAELERTVIRAPIPGIVVLPEAYLGGKKRKPRIGDVVVQNQPLVYLPDISKMVVKTKIREIDLYKVDVGKAAVVLVDAYPELRLSGQVQSIGVLAEAPVEVRGGDKYFQIVVSITEEELRLRPGMTARVEIECAKVKDKISVPIHALFDEGGRTYCYVDVRNSYEKREVSVGTLNEHWAAIKAGLSRGEYVALSQPLAAEIRGLRTLPSK